MTRFNSIVLVCLFNNIKVKAEVLNGIAVSKKYYNSVCQDNLSRSIQSIHNFYNIHEIPVQLEEIHVFLYALKKNYSIPIIINVCKKIQYTSQTAQPYR